ncbi:MAG: hypothetical protein P8N76_23865, partial [Pirellulaceae bacterium]|nr:hypothetical protein [Pirellulaceae bacterium]
YSIIVIRSSLFDHRYSIIVIRSSLFDHRYSIIVIRSSLFDHRHTTKVSQVYHDPTYFPGKLKRRYNSWQQRAIIAALFGPGTGWQPKREAGRLEFESAESIQFEIEISMITNARKGQPSHGKEPCIDSFATWRIRAASEDQRRHRLVGLLCHFSGYSE